MKRDDITVGKIYTNGKGAFREVIGRGPEFTLYDGQGNLDCLRYRLLAKRVGPDIVWSQHNCTLTSFAAWAREEVSESSVFASALPATVHTLSRSFGVIIGADADRLFQFVGGRKGIVSHELAAFAGTAPARGDLVDARYGRDGKPAFTLANDVREPDQLM